MKRGEIYYADLGKTYGSEQGGIRPVLLISNDIGNRYSPTVIILPFTSKNKVKLPTHVDVPRRESGLPKDSTLLTEQVRTIDKQKIIDKCGQVSDDVLMLVDLAMLKSLGINKVYDDVTK